MLVSTAEADCGNVATADADAGTYHITIPNPSFETWPLNPSSSVALKTSNGRFMLSVYDSTQKRFVLSSLMPFTYQRIRQPKNWG